MSDNERLRHLETLERPPCVVGTLAGLTYAMANFGGDDGTIYLAPANYPVNANYTIPSNVHLVAPKGSYFTVADGMILAFNGTFEAGLYRVFELVGTAQTTFAYGKGQIIYPQWWGATGDGVTDDTVALQATINSCPWRGVVVFAGNFVVTATLQVHAKQKVKFAGYHGVESAPNSSTVNYTGNDVLFNGYTVAGNRLAWVIENLTILGTGQTGTAVRTCHYRFTMRNCTVEGFEIGVRISGVTDPLVECRIDGSNFLHNTFPIVVDGDGATDGFLTGCVIAHGTTGFTCNTIGGWIVTDNHWYSLLNDMVISGAPTRVVIAQNIFDVDRGLGITGGVGIDFTITGSIQGGIIADNVFYTATADTTFIDFTVDHSNRVLVVGNQFFAAAGTLGTTGIAIGGAATLYGRAVANNFANLVTDISGAATTFEFLDISSVTVSTSATRLQFNRYGGTPALITTTNDMFRIAAANFPPLTIERTSNHVTNAPLSAQRFLTSTTQDMVDGFGTGFDFAIEDDAAVENRVAAIAATRDGADNSGRLELHTASGGVLAAKATIDVDGIMELLGTVGALLVHRLTTAQRNALAAVNGMIIYNTTTNRIEAYEAGAWVDL